ncbi:MAG: response regulator transcription factor [Chloroflexi bacterium]|nr:response regulator transcription factor [Chloroflexota bacterium]
MLPKLLHRFERAGGPRQESILYEELTPRELDVLRLVAEGLSNKEIAAKLVLSEKTIKNRISNIFAKLQVNDRTQAVLRALRTGLVHLPDEGAH